MSVAPAAGRRARADAEVIDDPSRLTAELELAGTLDGPQPGTPFDRSGSEVGAGIDALTGVTGGDRPA